jgi:hypothetical protein
MTNDDKEERRDVSEERIEAMSELVVVLEEYLAIRRSKEGSHLPPSEPEAVNAGYSVSQRDLASRLADELHNCGHNVCGADILDALASTGLLLTPDAGSLAADDYADVIRDLVQERALE